jgi:hypothetical protein
MGDSMTKSCRFIATGVFALLTVACDSFAAKAVSLEIFRIQSQVPHWTQDIKSYQHFDSKGLFSLLDGGAPEYIDNGMKQGFFQRLLGPDSATVELYAEDFGSDKNAKKMMAVKLSGYSGDSPSAISDSSGIIVREVIGGCWACGAIGRFYFELTLMGIKDTAKAKGEIKSYFNFFRAQAETR